MKREKKNLQSRQRIFEGALKEFSAKSYAEASLNNICNDNDISKGIIYHHFKDKDELYLLCVKECFDALTAYLSDAIKTLNEAVEEHLRGYFDARLRFFSENPLYLNLFCNAIINPPVHLLNAISEIKSDFDTLNISVLTALLERVSLRPGVTVSEVVEDFRTYQDFFNARYLSIQQGCSAESILHDHEERCHRQLKMLLYGVIGCEK
ncbi:MAG: transcriptional regulator [Sphingobacterium sp.]|jgi:AcrR family transcriptional regulator|nr:transcriptional regulator [Sphingobacterium sp.]